MAFVNGYRYSLLIDFNNRCMYRVNGPGRSIIELGNSGHKISEVIEKANVKREEVLGYINELSGKGLAVISGERPDGTANGPLTDKALPGLRFLWIEVTSRCNLRCLHCYADAGPKREAELPGDTIKKVIYEAAGMGCKQVQFTGGECTLRRDLADHIEYAKHKGFEHIEVFTNGTLLDEPLIRYFKRSNVRVALSLYSHEPAVHDAITGVTGSFNRLRDNLKALLENKVATRGAIIAMKQNEEKMNETVAYFQRMGIVDNRPDPVRPGGRGKKYENWPHKACLHRAKTAPGFRIDEADFTRNRTWNSCWCGEAAVAANGDVLPCVFVRGLVTGNVKERPLSDIISGNMQKYWGLNMDKVDVCRDCEYRYLCFDCRPYALGMTDDLHAKNPRCSYDPYTGQWKEAEDTLLYKTLAKYSK